MNDTKYICPDCGKNLSKTKGPRMLDAKYLICKNCKSSFIKYSRSGKIVKR